MTTDQYQEIAGIMEDRYFKYLSSVGARPTLTDCTLRWSRPSRFNDLFDMAVPFAIDFDADYVTRRAIDLMWERVRNPGNQPPMNQMGRTLDLLARHQPWSTREQLDELIRPGIEQTLANFPEVMGELNREVIEHLRTTKVLCLSKANDNNMMWGVYAEEHRGLVLEFRNNDAVDSVYKLAKPVSYSNFPPPMLDDEQLANFLAGNIKLTSDLVGQLILLKSEHWSNEEELRIASGYGRNSDAEFEDIPFHPSELVAVYYGARGAELRAELDPIVAEIYPHAQRWQASQGAALRIDFTRLN